jgi:hypothetical protein
MLSDQTAGAEIVFTPYASYAYLDPALPATRYGVGNWLEVRDPETGEVYENASQGAFGFSPWIDRRRNLAGVLVVYDSLQSAMPVYWELKNRIRAAVPPDVLDAAAPSVSGVTLSKAKVNRRKDPTVTISWTSADDRGVASHDVVFAPDGSSFMVPVASGLAGDASSFTWTVPAAVPKTKTGVVKVIARDGAGNSGEATSGRLRIK